MVLVHSVFRAEETSVSAGRNSDGRIMTGPEQTGATSLERDANPATEDISEDNPAH
jgi:hypothetical protein